MLSQPMNQMLKPTRKFNQKSNIFSLIKEKNEVQYNVITIQESKAQAYKKIQLKF